MIAYLFKIERNTMTTVFGSFKMVMPYGYVQFYQNANKEPLTVPYLLILTYMLLYHCIHLCQFPLQLGDLLLVIDNLRILIGNQFFQFPIFWHNHSL